MNEGRKESKTEDFIFKEKIYKLHVNSKKILQTGISL